MCHNAFVKGYMSTRIMAQMSNYCISQIFYKRKILNVKYFDEQIVDSKPFYILKKNLGNSRIALNFQKWFKIIKEAIFKNYVILIKVKKKEKNIII